MDKHKIDRVIDAFRAAMYNEFDVSEEGMVANPPGGSGGFSSSSPAKGPTAGFDPVMNFEKSPRLDGRRKYLKKFVVQLLKSREKRKNKKEIKTALNYNPYFTPPGNGKS